MLYLAHSSHTKYGGHNNYVVILIICITFLVYKKFFHFRDTVKPTFCCNSVEVKDQIPDHKYIAEGEKIANFNPFWYTKLLNV